jgi:hypothetical protein
MRFPPLPRTAVLTAAAVMLLTCVAEPALSQRKGPPKGEADQLLKPGPRPKRAALPPSKLPLELVKGERIALLGNSTAERMNLFGHFETLLHTRFPDKELVVRNFARPAEAVDVHQRSADYTHLDDPLYAFGADTFVCFFGFNESFAGPAGVEKFKTAYEKFLDEYAAKYPRDDEKSPPRFVLASPIAFEYPESKYLPTGDKENENLKLYADAVKAVAAKRGVAFVDLFTADGEGVRPGPGLARHDQRGARQQRRGPTRQPGARRRAVRRPDAGVGHRAVREAAGGRQRQIVRPLPGLPDGQRLVRLRRPADL